MTLFDLFDDRLFFIRVNASSSLAQKSKFGEAGRLGLTFPLESVQDLVKKTERANWGETHTIRQKHPEEIPKRYKVG